MNFNEPLDSVYLQFSTNNSIENVINNKLKPLKKFPLCPFFQLSYDDEESILFTLPGCKECGLCEMKLKDKNVEDLSFKNHSALIDEIVHLAYFLNLVFPQKKYFSKVSTNGYSRSIIIDIVELDNSKSTIVLYKVIHRDKDSNGKYKRAYEKVIDDLSKLYPEFSFTFKFISNYDDSISNIYSINNLIKGE
ncbi:hypothetical protein HMPREF3058_08195 [Staphylococcus sp. HMSC068G11]|uniref:hypothetical protein n=1 Tax=Staphylococcus TaxID=1279 RepID=UPI0008A273A7|nr:MULTISPECIES: hypothetical protein [Staphylococcus]OFO15157.1 hypothetical protein HMPREF3058_08195 [Staphylococcus sp. HMSC068G11]